MLLLQRDISVPNLLEYIWEHNDRDCCPKEVYEHEWHGMMYCSDVSAGKAQDSG